MKPNAAHKLKNTREMGLIVFLLAIFIIPAIFLIGSAEADGGYRASCATYSDCNNSQNLDCDEATKKCECIKPLYFSIIQAKCVSYAGERCILPKQNDDLPPVNCVDNAECVRPEDSKLASGKGICQCLPGFQKSKYAFCEEPKAAGFEPFRSSASTRNSFLKSSVFLVLLIFNIALRVDRFFDVF